MYFFSHKKQEKKIKYNDFARKINYQLTKHFFSLEKIKQLSFYELKKVIKLISKIEKVTLTRKEIVNIARFFQNDFKVQKNVAAKLWHFIEFWEVKISKLTYQKILACKLLFVKNYRMDKYDLMLN